MLVTERPQNTVGARRESVPPPTNVALLRAEKLSKQFGGTQALSDVDLVIAPQEVRALVGRNGAGKSTLVSILTGMLQPDTGTVRWTDEAVPVSNAPERSHWNVACVYQHPKIIPALSCAENLFLGNAPGWKGWVRWGAMRSEARKVFTEWGLAFDVDTPAGDLGIGERQLLEIARALRRGSRLLILDEPTARLEAREVQRLFEHIRTLAKNGVGVLFISHHLEEIFDLCNSVTVLRDGHVSLSGALNILTRSELVEAMVGYPVCAAANASARSARAADARAPWIMQGIPSPVPEASASEHRATRLEVASLACHSLFEDVTFNVRGGECLGIAGLTGSGKEALGEALAGLRPWQHGTVRVDDSALPGGDVTAHNRLGIGFVPEDRHAQGLILGMTVADNATLSIPDQLGKAGFIRPRKLDQFARKMIGNLDIRTPSPREPVAALSGGNQQRVVLARALARGPRVLVLIHPTAGVDIASKMALFTALACAASGGAALVLISDELEELAFCDRILVIRDRRITQEFLPPYSDAAVVAEMEGVSA